MEFTLFPTFSSNEISDKYQPDSAILIHNDKQIIWKPLNSDNIFLTDVIEIGLIIWLGCGSFFLDLDWGKVD